VGWFKNLSFVKVLSLVSLGQKGIPLPFSIGSGSYVKVGYCIQLLRFGRVDLREIDLVETLADFDGVVVRLILLGDCEIAVVD
jgi:hypothetical protein